MSLTPQEVMNVIADKNRQLTMKNEELVELSEKQADAKREYLKSLAQEITKLKIEGQSVTLIKDLAKGDKIVAELGYKADVAFGVRDACKEKIADLRSGIESSRSILSFLKAEFEVSRG